MFSYRNGSLGSVSGVVILMLCTPMAHAAESFHDTFDDGDASCWRGGTAWTDVVVEPTGGNDGGWLRSITTQSPYYAGIVTSKPEAGGDWLIAQVSALQADVRRAAGASSGGGFRLREGADVNGWFYAVPAEAITDTWSTLVAPIDPMWSDQDAIDNGWSKEGPDVPSWQDTLASNYQVAFRAWGGAGLEMGFDNFLVTFDGPSCQADVNEDRQVNVADILQVLAAWNICDCCPQDVNRDRTIDFADILPILAAWGPCWEEE